MDQFPRRGLALRKAHAREVQAIVRRVRVRCTLAVSAVALALLLVCAATAVAAEGGAIAGKVTSAAAPHEGVGNVEVRVLAADGEVVEAMAITKATGEYTVSGLAEGTYKVQFSPTYASGNYLTQYYEDSTTLAGAKAVAVTGTATTEEINAELQAGAQIEGNVSEATESEDIVPLQNIEVTVYEAEGNEFPVGFATTNVQGHYVVDGLPKGSYKVEFSGGREAESVGAGGATESEEGLGKPQDFLTQFYKEEPSLALADKVKVEQGDTAEGIDAYMQRGAEIEGVVTNASTHAAINGITVAVIDAAGKTVAYAETGTGGRYLAVGLPSGSYSVEFSGERFVTQYFDGESSLASANPVAVSQPNTTAGIDAALVPKAPIDATAPVASGIPAVGQRLSCTHGTWTGSPAPGYSYAWLRDGVAIAGATGSTYGVQVADEGNGLTCKVTASNKYGSAVATSNTLIVPVPSPPPPVVKPPVLSLSGSKIVVHGDTARVAVACANATCAGTVELTARLVTHRGRHRHGRLKTVLLARASYELTAGHRKTVVLRLAGAGVRALAGASHHRLLATASGTVAGGKTVTRTVQLSLAPRRRRRRAR